MTAMLRPATPADRPDLIALALAEDAAWSGAAEVSAEEAGELIDGYRPGVIFERDGRVAGYAAVDEGGGTILLARPSRPGVPLSMRWSRGSGSADITRSSRTRLTRGGSRGSRRTGSPTGAPPSISNAASARRSRPRSGRAQSLSRGIDPARMTPPSTR